MGAKDFKSYIIYFLLAGLFVIALYSFATGIAENYNQNFTVDDSRLDLRGLEEQIETTGSQASVWESRFTSDNFFVSLGSIVLFSLWGIFKLIWSSINAFTTIFLQGMNNVLGVPPLVTGTLTAMLIIGMIFAIWRSIKTGE